MNLRAYLDRIRYSGLIAPTRSTLSALQAAHLQSVPFENLDIHLKRPLSLKENDLFDKIVLRKRGGFCYELNNLFAALLRELDFQVTLLSARVLTADGSPPPEFDHLVLQVQVPDEIDRWLVDVGFGDFALEPLNIDDTDWQPQADRAFKIDRDGNDLKVMLREHDGSIEPQYAFTLAPRSIEEFLDMCHYHQTSPESSFTRKRICTLATIDGRITLSDLNFIVTAQHIKTERALADETEYRSVLRDKFGIEL
jgi:N-hydroxyarylamine O-acetyltransferase